MASQLASPDTAFLFIEATSMFRDSFDKAVKEFAPDCIVTDMFLPWTTEVAAENNNIPRIVFHGTNIFSRCCQHSMDQNRNALETPPLSSSSSSSDEEDYVVVPGLPHEIKLLRSQIDMSKIDNPHRAAFFKSVADSESRSYGAVFNSFRELEPEYVDHYRNVLGRRAWPIGPVSLCNAAVAQKLQRGVDGASVDGQDCLNWLDGQKPRSVVYVCFGSMADLPSKQVPELALGLEASNRPFVWAMRRQHEFLPEGFEERTRGRGLVIRGWAPQIMILNHESVGCFVTHCGWNSSLEGMSAGVPLVTWPMFAEQFYNERLIVEVLGIGVGVGMRRYCRKAEEREVVEAGRVERAVEEVMGDGEEALRRRRRAEEVGEMARRAVEEGGSSYVEMGNLMREIMERRSAI